MKEDTQNSLEGGRTAGCVYSEGKASRGITGNVSFTEVIALHLKLIYIGYIFKTILCIIC